MHTFHDIDFQQDSTTSTDDTRRQSNAQPQTPAEQVDEPEPEIEARQATTGPVSCSIFGQIASKKLPAPCAVNGPTFAKNTRVTFTCQILTDEYAPTSLGLSP